MKITGFSIQTKGVVANDLKVAGSSFPLPFVEFAVARLVDKLTASRTVVSVSNAELYSTLSVAGYTPFADKALVFSSPPVSDEINFEFGWSISNIFLRADITYYRVLGRNITESFDAIPLDFIYQ